MTKILLIIIISCLIINFIINLFYYQIEKINNKLLFWSTQLTDKQFDLFCDQNKLTIKNMTFIANDKSDDKNTNTYSISSILINRIKQPTLKDKIIFYCHGNSWCIKKLFTTSPIKMVSNLKNTSAFVFDYRGYGNTKGETTENNLYQDAYNAWNHLTLTLKVSEDNIIIYGRSLGTAIATNLMVNLINQKRQIPKILFLDSPFVTLQSTANKFFCGLGKFVTFNFNNLKNLTIITKNTNKNNLKIYLLHSKEDQLVKYSESLDLINKIGNNRCKLIDINGSHMHPRYNDNIVKFIQNEIESII